MPKKLGFTLVELSIVLVIIGLLVGGILAARSMIETASSQYIIRQITQYDIAVTNFQTRYDGLPGDATAFGGNGDGWIASSTSAGIFSSEAANFWIDLQQNGFMAGNGQFSATVPAGGFNSNPMAPNAPELKIGANPQVILYDQASIYFMPTSLGPPYYAFYQIADWHGSDPSINTGAAKPGIPVNQAAAIDIKIDDGNPGTGIVESRITTTSGTDAGTSCDNFDYSHQTTAVYTQGTSAYCYLAIGMSGQKLNTPFLTR